MFDIIYSFFFFACEILWEWNYLSCAWCVKFGAFSFFLSIWWPIFTLYSSSGESDAIPALNFTNKMGLVFENNRYRTTRLLSHPVIIFLCSPFFFELLYFFLTVVIAQAVSIETSEHVWIERAKTSKSAHYQGIIMQPIYTCSLQG